MNRGRLLGRAALVVAGAVAAAGYLWHPKPELDMGSLPEPSLHVPRGEARSILFLLSGAEGWAKDDEDTAQRLQERGVIVVGIDLPRWLRRLEEQKRECAYTISDVESVSRQLQRDLGSDRYLSPIVAGAGAGGAMALAMAAQSPAATLEATISADPDPFIPLDKPLCTPAARKAVQGGMQYGLRKIPLTHPVTVVFTPQSSDAARAHVDTLRQEHPDLAISTRKGNGLAALEAEVDSHVTAQTASAVSLPVAVTAVDKPSDLMAVIISGDGGWRDIDKKMAAFLAEAGIPSVGLDSLRYFWTEKTPETTAHDLDVLIDQSMKRFGARRVILVGYSFGANVLPSSFLHMQDEQREKVALVALLAPSPLADFRIAVTGWLGFSGEGKHGKVADDIGRMQGVRVLCIFGEAEKESACHDVPAEKATIVGLKGGHHFDGDYRALTERVLSFVPK